MEAVLRSGVLLFVAKMNRRQPLTIGSPARTFLRRGNKGLAKNMPIAYAWFFDSHWAFAMYSGESS
jgi:hypothetical protein